MLIIDGYNLFYKRKREKTAEELIISLQIFCDYYKKKCILVFDGEWDYQKDYDTHFLTVLYVKNADETIRFLIKQNQNSKVVTSDNEISRFAINNNSKIIKSENFTFDIAQLASVGKGEISVSQKDIAEYLDELKKNKR